MMRTRSARLFWAALVTLNVGTAPLVIYVLFGPRDGPTLGLGLLMALWLSWIIGIVLLLGAAVSYLRAHAAVRMLPDTSFEKSKEPG